MLTPDRLIGLLGLEPLPVEGGYFRQTYRAGDLVASECLPARYTSAKALGSAIYYLLHDGHVSALHRLPTDEVYHFYLGDPVELLLLHPDEAHEVVVLGHNLEAGQRVQAVAPRGAWQGSRVRPGGRFALLGTTMAPAYDPSDFEPGERDSLLREYPACAALIDALTPRGLTDG